MKNPFSALLGRPAEAKALDVSSLSWSLLGGGAQSKAGVPVSVETALRVTTVLACVRVLSEGIAQIPLKLMQETTGGAKSLAMKHPLYDVLYRRPNPWQTPFQFRETMMLHALLDRGGFAYISRSSSGKVLELLPLLPSQVAIRQEPDFTVKYWISGNGITGEVPASDLFRVQGPSWNTYSALEMVTQAREAIGLAIATEESLERLHSNGTRPSGVLSTDQKLTPEAIKRITASFAEGYAGVHNAFKTILLDNGFKFSATSLSPHDAQSEVTRIRQVEEIARVFRVFPQLIGYADKTATYASAEQFFTAHVVHSLGPWIERWEQAISRDLLSLAEVQAGYYPKFVVAGLLRGDAASRSTYYKNGIVDGWLTRNEARALEDFNSLPHLDEPLVPLNMQTPAQQQEAHDQNMAGQQATADAAAAAADVAATGGDAPSDNGAGNPKARAFADALEALATGETKAGRALSARNETKITTARDTLNEVLAEVVQENAT